jgi:hypothetical protein
MGLRLSVLCPAVPLKKEVEPAVETQCFFKKMAIIRPKIMFKIYGDIRCRVQIMDLLIEEVLLV